MRPHVRLLSAARATALRGLIVCVCSALVGAAAAQGPARSGAAGTQAKPQYAPPPSSGSSGPVANAGADTRGESLVVLPVAGDYVIAANDTVDIDVDKAEELSAAYQVSAAGTISMPFLGSVVAQGKTAGQLAAEIADGLRGDYLRDPIVRVSVTQYSGQSFFIQGAVRSPGVYKIAGRPTLLELITIAGGLATDHGSTAYVIRKVKQPLPPGEAEPQPAGRDQPDAGAEEAPNYDLIKVNISGLLRGNFENNVAVQPGDIVNVPPTDVFFVAGEVHAPGSFPLKEGTTLRQAISLAEGTTFNAARDRVVIFREEPGTGKRTELRVDAGAVMEGKRGDVPLLANDVVVVPNSRAKSVGNALLRAFGLGTARIAVRY